MGVGGGRYPDRIPISMGFENHTCTEPAGMSVVMTDKPPRGEVW